MRRRQPTRHRNAFTLVEILVVVSIIALLIAILLPTLSRARKQVSRVACHSNLRQLMSGMFLYVADHDAFPATHGHLWMQKLFGTEWPRITGVTWDGARDRLVDLDFIPAYQQPYHLDPEYLAHVPLKGTIFSYINHPKVYACPADRPGKADDTPHGGGGNGRLSYALNAFVGYQSPERLGSFRYVAPSLNNPLPGNQGTRDFAAGQRVTFPAARFAMMFEEHPNGHLNADWPDGSFNGIDRIATRHMPPNAAGNGKPVGSTGIAYLDGHVAGPRYAAKTEGRALFTEYGQPHLWHRDGPNDDANVSAFIRQLSARPAW